jgi:hypothetical protein
LALTIRSPASTAGHSSDEMMWTCGSRAVPATWPVNAVPIGAKMISGNPASLATRCAHGQQPMCCNMTSRPCGCSAFTFVIHAVRAASLLTLSASRAIFTPTRWAD